MNTGILEIHIVILSRVRFARLEAEPLPALEDPLQAASHRPARARSRHRAGSARLVEEAWCDE